MHSRVWVELKLSSMMPMMLTLLHKTLVVLMLL
jgi:hypothetical protein